MTTFKDDDETASKFDRLVDMLSGKSSEHSHLLAHAIIQAATLLHKQFQIAKNQEMHLI